MACMRHAPRPQSQQCCCAHACGHPDCHVYTACLHCMVGVGAVTMVDQLRCRGDRPVRLLCRSSTTAGPRRRCSWGAVSPTACMCTREPLAMALTTCAAKSPGAAAAPLLRGLPPVPLIWAGTLNCCISNASNYPHKLWIVLCSQIQLLNTGRPYSGATIATAVAEHARR